jgi:ribosomal protein S21
VNSMVEVKNKGNEPFERLLRRFTKKIIQSGKLLQARKVRFKKKDKTKREYKEASTYRRKVQDERDYLKKIGKIDE